MLTISEIVDACALYHPAVCGEQSGADGEP